MLSTDARLEEVFKALCESVEEAVPGMLCSVLVVERGRLRLGAAPSLPTSFKEASADLEIAAGSTCCPNTAATGETTIAEDIEAHPFWAEEQRAVARGAGLRSCWSYPIRDRERRVAGTLALYYREPRSPSPAELELIEGAAEIAGIAVDYRRALEESSVLNARLRQIIDLVPHPIFAKDAEGRFLLANEAVARLYGITAAELTGAIHARLQPDSADLKRMLAQDREVLASGHKLEIPDETFVHRDGRVMYYETVKLPYVQTAGGEPAVLGVAVDITERKRREQQRQADLLRVHRQQEALVRVATDPALLGGELPDAFRNITEIVARTIEVDRVSVWLLSRDRSEMHQIDLYERKAQRHSEGDVLFASDLPTYFDAMRTSRAIDAHEAVQDARTAELAASYLGPMGITALLDAPIRVRGEVVGVVCHEHCGSPRTWTADEIAFGADVADQAAQALLQRERNEEQAALRRSENRYKKLSKELDARVRERTRQLGAANAELLVTEERERRLLAADLHDGPCQLLVLAQMKLAGLRRQVDGEALEEVRAIEAVVDQANRTSRSLTFQLSPPVLHDLGLAAAAEWLADDLRSVYDVEIRVEDDGRLRDLPERTRVILFRALRELLVNVGKHAGADVAVVRLSRSGDRAVVVVEDRGHGFDPEHIKESGFGLSSVRERLSHLGGSMKIQSTHGEGTRVELAAPLEDLQNPTQGENKT